MCEHGTFYDGRLWSLVKWSHRARCEEICLHCDTDAICSEARRDAGKGENVRRSEKLLRQVAAGRFGK